MTSEITINEAERSALLLDAQNKAVQLFNEIERTLLRSGVGEKTVSDEIHELAAQRYGVRTHWHKRLVRSGPHTLCPFEENPPDRTIEPGDILFVDLGPVFESWEADFGRTYVLPGPDGSTVDPAKAAIRDALEPTWHKVRARYLQQADTITGEGLYRIACEVANETGYEFGAWLAGHTVGEFPHERIPRDKIALYITDGNTNTLKQLDNKGRQRHWILEIHLVDKVRNIGGFFEQLLTVDPASA